MVTFWQDFTVRDGLTNTLKGARGTFTHRTIEEGSDKSHTLREVVPTHRAMEPLPYSVPVLKE